jgi:hypothetical protein
MEQAISKGVETTRLLSQIHRADMCGIAKKGGFSYGAGYADEVVYRREGYDYREWVFSN